MLKIRKTNLAGGTKVVNRFSSLLEQNAFIEDMHRLTKERIKENRQEDQYRNYDEVFYEVWHSYFIHWEIST